MQEGAEVAGALILKDREVKGDGVQHPCYLLSTGVTSRQVREIRTPNSRLKSHAHESHVHEHVRR